MKFSLFFIQYTGSLLCELVSKSMNKPMSEPRGVAKRQKIVSVLVGFIIGFLLVGVPLFFILGFGPLFMLYIHLYLKDLLILAGFLGLIGIIFLVRFLIVKLR